MGKKKHKNNSVKSKPKIKVKKNSKFIKVNKKKTEKPKVDKRKIVNSKNDKKLKQNNRVEQIKPKQDNDGNSQCLKNSVGIKIGQTLETNDIYLPYNKNRVPKSKKRPVLVIDKNEFNEFVIVPGSKQETKNTVSYNKYGLKNYRINIEIEDNEGNPIKENEKFKKTENCSVLPESEALKIKNIVLNHSRFSSENRKKYNLFIDRHKKK